MDFLQQQGIRVKVIPGMSIIVSIFLVETTNFCWVDC